MSLFCCYILPLMLLLVVVVVAVVIVVIYVVVVVELLFMPLLLLLLLLLFFSLHVVVRCLKSRKMPVKQNCSIYWYLIGACSNIVKCWRVTSLLVKLQNTSPAKIAVVLAGKFFIKLCNPCGTISPFWSKKPGAVM